MNEKISVLMAREHEKILKVLLECENANENIEKLFSKFKWSLEKHFFLEEKAIFTLSNDLGGEIVSEVFELMKEHGEMIELAKEIEDALEENSEFDISKLKELLIKHHRFEDSGFYPKLGEMLSQEQKQELSERVREVVRG